MSNLLVMRPFRHYALLALLFGSGGALFTITADACVVASIPVRVQPAFSVHVYNELGPVEGLKLKIVTLRVQIRWQKRQLTTRESLFFGSKNI